MSSRPGGAPKIRLAFGAFLWRSWLLFSFLIGLIWWARIQQMGFPPGQKFAVMLISVPGILGYSFQSAAIATVLTDLSIRFALGPMYRKWLNPPIDASASSFHLDVREAILATIPARKRIGRLWRTGTLVRTDRRVWFFPQSWDLEAWSASIAEVAKLETVEAPRMFLGFVRGLPARLRLETVDGAVEIFAVSDPDKVRSAFCPTEAALVSWIT